MDLPPSGWYPDPYGTPSMLRWWDGSGWTQHTHPDVTANGNGADGAPATAVQGAVQGAAAQATAVQDAIQATTIQATTIQPGAAQPTAVQSAVAATALQPAAEGQPSADWLATTKPPTGPPTQPQPALPVSPGAAPTAYQGTTVQAGAYQPTAAQPGAYQPTAVQQGYQQPGMAWGAGGGADGAGTQVMSFGDVWQGPGGPGGLGGPGAPMAGNLYGYQEAQQRRRRRLIIGLAAGAAAAIAAIAIIASSLGGSPSVPAADQSPAAPPPSLAAASPSPTGPVSPSASAPASASASPATTLSGSLVTDSQSGLSYNQLPAPWQGTASCPSTLNNGAFPWTDGEYAVAGQVNGNGGPVTWYGEACSGPLPQQYGYTGTADLQNAASTLASTFENAYYGALDHTIAPGQDAPIQVGGHAAWEVSYDVTYTNAAAQGASWTDEQAAVVVVDTGTATPAVFFTSIPYPLNESYIPALVSSLQLTAPAGSAGTPPPASAGTPPPSGPPANGSPNGGSGPGGGNGGGGSGGSHP